MEHTLWSPMEDTVCARTTRCANLMQHILTVGVAVSQICKTLCFIAIIFSHVTVSYELLILSRSLESAPVKVAFLLSRATYIHLSARG